MHVCQKQLERENTGSGNAQAPIYEWGPSGMMRLRMSTSGGTSGGGAVDTRDNMRAHRLRWVCHAWDETECGGPRVGHSGVH